MSEHNKHKFDLKHKFKQDFDIAQSFVNEFDPCRLIYAEAPIDEYDCLTTQLLSAVYSSKTRTEIKDLILHEIEHHLGAPDLETLAEPHKTEFYNDIEKLIDNLKQHIEKKPSH
ncbi:MAG: hypothetical protein KIT80_22470 [Chitinophagaceae bacterium]|nr:hypothetical protein [Chitinophagaceae bacterium]MCW5929701.1 hypothetical protein [Chitinophagaceae bacterium]